MLKAIIEVVTAWPTELKVLWAIITAAVIGYLVADAALAIRRHSITNDYPSSTRIGVSKHNHKSS